MIEQIERLGESDYIETCEGLFFAVKGMVHPPDRCLAILRYAPDPIGERWKGGRRYHRLYQFDEQEEYLREFYPHYLAFEPTIGVVLQSVPHNHIRRVYPARQKLAQLAQDGTADPLEQEALALARLLSREAGVPLEAIGVSGSLLIGLHTADSDLDLSVYGLEAGWAVHAALTRLLAAEQGEVRRLDPQGMAALYKERSARASMSPEEFAESEKEKVNQGTFRGRTYFLRFLLRPEEIDEQYGERRYISEGRAEITARVVDDRERLLTPCRYRLEAVEGGAANGIEEIVSFRGRFSDAARSGDLIFGRGMVERVEERSGRVWRRMVLGNFAEDTLLVRR
jgi:predicted nucleotidyltransferase